MDAKVALRRAESLARWGHVAYIYRLPSLEFYVTMTSDLKGMTLVGTYSGPKESVNPGSQASK